MTSYPPTLEKPGTVTAVAVLTLISGIINLFWGITLTIIVVLGSLGIGLLCSPLTILPSVLGIFEIIYAAKLLPNPIQPTRPSQVIAILEIVCIMSGNLFATVVGVLALVFYNDQQVKQYFAQFGR